jgi:AraC-like DNA-binding protein
LRKQLPRRGEHSVRSGAYCLGGGSKMMTPGKQFESISGRHDRPEPVEIWKARKFIEEHSSEELSLSKVAKAVNISPNYLSEKFKQVTGINFVDYIARTRFLKAREMLQNCDRRISEIAFAVGFQSLSQFNRVFKKWTRQSPTEFRSHRQGRKK